MEHWQQAVDQSVQPVNMEDTLWLLTRQWVGGDTRDTLRLIISVYKVHKMNQSLSFRNVRNGRNFSRVSDVEEEEKRNTRRWFQPARNNYCYYKLSVSEKVHCNTNSQHQEFIVMSKNRHCLFKNLERHSETLLLCRFYGSICIYHHQIYTFFLNLTNHMVVVD